MTGDNDKDRLGELSEQGISFYAFLRRELFNSVVGDYGGEAGSGSLRRMNDFICKILYDYDW